MEDLKKLEQVFVVRHGSESGGDLTPVGMTEIGRLAARLLELIPLDKSVMVLASTEAKVKQSAAILRGVLGFNRKRINWDFQQVLESDQYDDGPAAAGKITQCGGEKRGQVIIAVTHGWLPSGIADVFAKTFGGEVRQIHPECGNGFMVDLKERKVLLDLFKAV